MAPTQDASDRRASCEQCRQKKLKCDGGFPECGRCVSAGDSCKYSARRPMGRPKKRKIQSVDEEQTSSAATSNDTPPSSGERDQFGDLSPEINLDGLDLASHGAFGSSIDAPNWGCDTNSSTIPEPLTLGLEPVSGKPSCSCLASLYLSLEELRSADITPFTLGLSHLRTVTGRASAILQCSVCPSQFVWAMQNSQLLNTLLVSIAETYRRLVLSIEEEAQRATQNNEPKTFYLSESQPETLQQNAGDGSFIPPSFRISLDPARWELLAKEVVKADIFGSPHSSFTSFAALLQLMEDRQTGWHSGTLGNCAGMAHAHAHNHHRHSTPGKEPMCVTLVRHTKSLINSLPLNT